MLTVTYDRHAVDAAERLAAVHRYRILDAAPDSAFTEIVEIAAVACDAPIATVTVVALDRVWFAASRGLDGVLQIGNEPGLCATAILADGPYVVRDAGVDPRTSSHPLVRGGFGLRFYAGAPIVTPDGFRLGTVNVMDRRPRELSGTQLAQLCRLAVVVSHSLDLRLEAINAIAGERLMRGHAERRAVAETAIADRLREAAEQHSSVAPMSRCQLGEGDTCGRPAELKLADPWGDSAWGCIDHVEQALAEARGVFLAEPDQGLLAAFLARVGKSARERAG